MRKKGKEIMSDKKLREKSSERMMMNNPNKDGKLWRDDRFIEKFKKSINLKPNKKEKILIDLIKDMNLPFKYVGDFSFRIDTFFPDFISTDGSKKIIELNGDHWHEMKIHIERDKRKLDCYSRNGYKTLIIWEKELKDIDNVYDKINNWLLNTPVLTC